MKRYDTPPEVAAVLARHCPRNVTSVLDPSVGSGVLVAPFLSRLKGAGKVTCVDISPEAIIEAKQNLGEQSPSGVKVRFVEGDFLDWSERQKRSLRHSFDVVVLNPPFAGKLSEWRSAPSELFQTRSRVPLEIAFLVRCIELAKPGGSVLAIVPASVVSGEQTNWVRQDLLKKGAIRFVRELPRSTFPGVECRFYLLVFVKGGSSDYSVLCNHDLEGKERMHVPTSLIEDQLRLDFAYFESLIEFASLRRRIKCSWSKLHSRCSVFRGRLASPAGAERGMHTTDWQEGFWLGNERHLTAADDDRDLLTQPGDILMSRVGRRCLTTCGHTRYANRIPLSDCVVCIRPNRLEDSLPLLFALRVLFGSKAFQSQLVRGSGASFVTVKGMQNVELPMRLNVLFAHDFRKFVAAASLYDFKRMLIIESAVRKKLSLE